MVGLGFSLCVYVCVWLGWGCDYGCVRLVVCVRVWLTWVSDSRGMDFLIIHNVRLLCACKVLCTFTSVLHNQSSDLVHMVKCFTQTEHV